MKSKIKRVGALMLVAVVFAACSESNVDSPVGPQFGQQSLVDAPAVVTIEVCKVYSDVAAQGDYTFAFSGAQAADGEVVLTAGDGTGSPILAGCADEGASTTFQVDRGSTFSVTELAVGEGLATLGSVSLLPFEGSPGDNPASCHLNEPQATVLATGTASVTIDDNTCGSDFYQIGFKNVQLDDPPEGGEGCTPGYWRQPHHYGNWTAPYAPGTPFHDVFEGDEYGDATLGEAVAFRGGGLNALARHAVAGLLNAAHSEVSYGMSTQGVIDAYNAARTGDRSTMNAQKDEFDSLNNAGCELGRAELEVELDVATRGNKNKKG